MRTLWMALFAVFLAQSMVAPSDTQATTWAMNTHWDLTDSLLKNGGWKNQAAIDKVVNCNLGTDVIASNFGFIYDDSAAETDSIQALANTFPPNTKGTNAFHFDDLFSYAAIKKRMEDLETWMNQQIAVLVAAGWGEGQQEKLLRIFGMISHAIQDFYCHSNYVNQLNPLTAGKNFTPGDFPTWDELHSDLGGWGAAHPGFPKKGALEQLEKSNGNPTKKEKDEKGNPRGGLQTGAYDKNTTADPAHPGTRDKPWRHRHPGGTEADVAIALGARATRQWIDKAMAQLPIYCRTQFLTYVTTPDSTVTQVEENPTPKQMIHRAFGAVGEEFAPYSRINVTVPGGGIAAAFTDSVGTVGGFRRCGHEYSDIEVVATQAALHSVAESSTPEVTALAEELAGNLVVSRGGTGPGALAQSTFIDGTQGGTACGSAPCWPGIRGDGGPSGVFDNFNSPLGDSILVAIGSELRPDGMGVNWRLGYDVGTGALNKQNQSFNPALGPPRMIFRLYDPSTRAWSPFDSTEIYADGVAIVGGDTVLVGGGFRVDWPPLDKLPSGVLPGGFTVGGQSLYSNLAFLPRGAKIQYTFRSIEIDGTARYGYRILRPESPVSAASQSFDDDADGPVDGPYDMTEPRLFTFAVLPSVYPPGAAGSQLAGRTRTPLLLIDANYLEWGTGGNPVFRALRGMGVRADLFRLCDPGLHRGNGIGGHEHSGVPPAHQTNFHPNREEWALLDSLSTWYRLIILDTGDQLAPVVEDSDASVLRDWWGASTGFDGGDRCFLAAGDNLASGLTGGTPPPTSNQLGFATQVLGLSAANSSWPNASATRYPMVDDRFAAPSAGPGLAPPGSYTYMVDGGSGNLSIADEAFLGGSPTVQSGGWPLGAAALSTLTEQDPIADRDKNKSEFYGFSSQFTRTSGIPVGTIQFAHSGIDARVKLLYKFLTSCRSTPPISTPCWPCPTGANDMFANWNAVPGFQTGTYGGLYPIQDSQSATGVDVPLGPRFANALGFNRPNPFNPVTTIPYSLAREGRVEIHVFDVAGRLVRTLVSDVKPAGAYSVRWNGQTDGSGQAPSGIYFYRITYPDGSVSAKKLAMLK